MLCRTNSRIGIDLCSFLRFCLAPLRGSSFTRPVLFVGVVFSCQQQKLCFDLLRLPFEKHANETKKESVDSNVKPPPLHMHTHARTHMHTRTHARTHRHTDASLVQFSSAYRSLLSSSSCCFSALLLCSPLSISGRVSESCVCCQQSSQLAVVFFFFLFVFE